MNKREDIAIVTVWALMLTVTLMLLFAGCKPQTVVVTEYRDRYVHDTTQVVDSVWRDRWHTVTTKGDTVFVHDSVFVDRYKYRDKVRDVYVHDSIPYEVEVVKEVPRERSGYDKFVSRFFWVAVAILLVVLLWWVADYIPVLRPYKTIIRTFLRLKS